MKKMIITLLLILIFQSTQNNKIPGDIFKDFREFIWRKEKIPFAIMQCETADFDEKIINKTEDAAGVLQIRPIMVKEVNRIIGYQKYKLTDRFSFEKSLEMFYIFQDYWNPDYDPEKAARLWNGGEDGMKKKSTEKYYKNFSRHYAKTGK